MKLIVGYFDCKPGKRAAYLAAAQHHLRESRKNPDCLYIELVPMPDNPDRLLLADGFTSEDAHRRHEDTDHMRDLWAIGPSHLNRVVIDNVIAASVDHVDEHFD